MTDTRDEGRTHKDCDRCDNARQVSDPVEGRTHPCPHCCCDRLYDDEDGFPRYCYRPKGHDGPHGRFRAPTSDTEDVGEEIGLAVAAVARHLNDAPDHVREAFGTLLARLRRTPETDALLAEWCGCNPASSNPNDYYAEHRLRLGSPEQRIKATEAYLDNLRVISTQDPNAGGEDG